MAKFVLITEAPNDSFFQRVSNVYGPDDCLKVSDTLILIHSQDELTANQVSSRIDQDGPSPLKELGVRYVIFSVTSYQGWHMNSMWTWLNSKGI